MLSKILGMLSIWTWEISAIITRASSRAPSTRLSLPLRSAPNITNVIREFLAARGEDGATLREIYGQVYRELGEQVSTNSIQANLYRRLVTSKSPYIPLFERFSRKSEVRYRIAKER